MPLVNPVIVVPGITASNLRDEYLVPPETVWAVLTKDYDRIALHPDNIRYEAKEPARITPDYVFKAAYGELIEELRYNLREKEDLPVPVFPFSYDWRQPLEMVEIQLAEFVKEVIERTKLMRHYYNNGYADKPLVNLVGHSMGGLIITGYLQRYSTGSRISKVVTIGTPFRGSFEAVVQISTGTGNLGTGEPSSRQREAARLTPALYHLLPSCDGIDVAPGLPTSLFDPGIWQKSLIDTLKEYVRLHSCRAGGDGSQATELFKALLKTASDHRIRIDGFQLSQAGLSEKDWLCIIGADAETRVNLKVKSNSYGPDFDFGPSYRTNKWSKGKTPDERMMTGDGTVPFKAALPPFLGAENVVCVTPDDYGTWEVQDRILSGVSGFHGIFPNMDMLHRLIVRHFTGQPDSHRNTWGRPAPGVKEWQPPIERLTDISRKNR